MKTYLAPSTSKPQMSLAAVKEKDAALRALNRDFARLSDIPTYNSLLQ